MQAFSRATHKNYKLAMHGLLLFLSEVSSISLPPRGCGDGVTFTSKEKTKRGNFIII